MIGTGLVRRACCSLLGPSGVRWRRGLRGVRSVLLCGIWLVLRFDWHWDGIAFRTWSVADGCIERCADNGNVVVLIRLDKALDRLQVGEAGNAGEGPLDNYMLGIVRISFLGYCSIIPPDPIF